MNSAAQLAAMMAALQHLAIHKNDLVCLKRIMRAWESPRSFLQPTGGCADGVRRQGSPTPLVLAHPELALVPVLVLKEAGLDPELSVSS